MKLNRENMSIIKKVLCPRCGNEGGPWGYSRIDGKPFIRCWECESRFPNDKWELWAEVCLIESEKQTLTSGKGSTIL